MKEQSLFHKVTIAIIVLWLLLFALIPNIIMFVVSFMEYDSSSFVKAVFTLDNYKQFFSDNYFKIFINSFKIAAIATLLCLFIGYPFAYILARSKSRYKGLLALLVVIPYWTSALIRTYAIFYMLSANGLINTILIKIGIIDAPLKLLYTEGAVIFGFVYTLLPFMILPLYATIEKFDFKYIEAAQDLGASKIRTFYHIILPLTSPGIIAGVVLVFLPALGLFMSSFTFLMPLSTCLIVFSSEVDSAICFSMVSIPLTIKRTSWAAKFAPTLFSKPLQVFLASPKLCSRG